MIRWLALAVVLIGVGMLLAAPGASAAIRCVGHNGPGCSAGSPYVDINVAVTAANADDTIRIAPGLYPEQIATNKLLHFEGFGLNAGSLAVIDGPDGSPAVELNRGGSIRRLEIHGGNGPTAGYPAVSFRANIAGTYSLAVSDVRLTGGDRTAASGAPGPGLEVLTAAGAVAHMSVARSLLRSGDITTATGGPGAEGVDFDSPGTLTMTDVTSSGLTSAADGSGVLISSGNASLDRVAAEGSVGVAVSGGSALIRRSTVRGTAAAGVRVFGATLPSVSMTLRDSLVTAVVPASQSESGAASVSSFLAGGSASLTATGTTFRTGGAASAGITARRPSGKGPTSVDLRNSVVLHADPGAGRADLIADGAQVSAAHSSYTGRILLNGGSAPTPGSGTNLSGNPLLSASLGLLPGSPLVDRGDPTALLPGELDLAGVSRSLDGNGDCAAHPDIGAFERPAVTPASCTQTVRISSASASNKTFAPVKRGGKVAARKRKKPKRGTRFRYTLSEAATVRVVIERITRGRRITTKGKRVCARPTRKRRKRKKCNRYKRVTTLTASQEAGRRSIPFTGRVKGKALKTGKYRARLTATDRQGARSAERRLSLRIVKP